MIVFDTIWDKQENIRYDFNFNELYKSVHILKNDIVTLINNIIQEDKINWMELMR